MASRARRGGAFSCASESDCNPSLPTVVPLILRGEYIFMFHTCPSKRTVSVQGTQAPHRNHPQPFPMPMICPENCTAAWRTGYMCIISTRPATTPPQKLLFHIRAHPPSLGSDVHFIFSPGKFQAPYFMCALANFTEISWN